MEQASNRFSPSSSQTNPSTNNASSSSPSPNNNNNNSSKSSSKSSSPSSRHLTITMPSSNSSDSNSSSNNNNMDTTYSSLPRQGRPQFGSQFRSALQDTLTSEVRQFQDKMKAKSTIGSSIGAQQQMNEGGGGGSKFSRSISDPRFQVPHFKMPSYNQRESLPIVEFPSRRSPTDSLDDDDYDDNYEDQQGGGPYAIVTSPVANMPELVAELHSSDSDGVPGNYIVPYSGGGGGGGGRANSLFQSKGGISSRLRGGSPSSLFLQQEDSSRSSSYKTKAEKANRQMRGVGGGGDLSSYSEENNSAAAASASKEVLESSSGTTVAEKLSGMKHHSKRIMSGDLMRQESSNLESMSSGSKMQTSSFGFENMTQASSSLRSSMSAGGTAAGGAQYHHQSSHQSSSSSSKLSVIRASSLLTAKQITQLMNTKMTIEELEKGFKQFDDLECLTPTTNVKNVENALVKYCGLMTNTVEEMKKKDGDAGALSAWMCKINDMMTKAWEVPAFGHEMGNTLCDILRNNGGLDIIIANCVSEHKDLQFNSAKLLQQCLVTENRGYVVEKGLDKVVEVAKNYTTDIREVERSRVGTGILEHLFKHSESTCSDVIAMGGLDTVVNECKSTDVETLRHCASALANVAMYGGAENQEAMIKQKVPSWLFPLAFHDDDTIKYYACLAIAALVVNKEIEAAVQKSGTLELIEPFVQTHTPRAFAETSATHSHGQSPNWLKRLIPVLMSHREEARNLAAFHFCMEAEIKKQQGKTELFTEIGAIESLKKVASSPSGIASKYAAQTLRLIGEEVPHKLSQQVPTWSVTDVREWVKQIGFPQYADSFAESRVDGDLLLQLSDEMLREDINMRNGILRRRFLRELMGLKRMADYSSCDPSNLNEFLQTLGPEYSTYTYDLINAGIDRGTLLNINDEHLLSECGISNKIHRLKIQQGVKVERGEFSIADEGGSIDKNLDVFISYRRSNGSQLASLLKVHLEIRNISVFLDVDRLEAGKFDNNLLQSIRSARNFVLVLTPSALDRCFNDGEQQDWIHKEVACAIQSNCNIIPVFDNFVMPDPVKLPESMRAVTSYNGVKWIHDYQEACVDKIDRFIRGDNTYVMDRFLNSQPSGSSAYGSSVVSAATYNRQNTYQRTISADNSTCSDEANHNSSGSAKEL